MGDYTGPSPKIEFNSMVAVLNRLSDITDRINDARTMKNKEGQKVMLENLIQYYKELYGDLDSGERKIWDDIQILNKIIYSINKSLANWKLWRELDLIDLKLRDCAKNHGYTTANKKDARSAITNL